MRNRFMIEGVSVSPDHFINGKRVSSPSTFETRCPFDWANKLADISRGDAETAALAVTAATNAFPIRANMTSAERRKYLHRLSEIAPNSPIPDCARQYNPLQLDHLHRRPDAAR